MKDISKDFSVPVLSIYLKERDRINNGGVRGKRVSTHLDEARMVAPYGFNSEGFVGVKKGFMEILEEKTVIRVSSWKVCDSSLWEKVDPSFISKEYVKPLQDKRFLIPIPLIGLGEFATFKAKIYEVARFSAIPKSICSGCY